MVNSGELEPHLYVGFFLLFFCLQYIVECHGNTLLPQFLGMYRLTVDGDETYMIVTRNVFSPRLPVHKKYDLKVSAQGLVLRIRRYIYT